MANDMNNFYFCTHQFACDEIRAMDGIVKLHLRELVNMNKKNDNKTNIDL